MLTAIGTAIVGTGACFAIGMGLLGMSAGDALLTVLASNLGGFCALMFTQRTRRWIRGGVKTWAFFLAIYWACQLGFAPALREWKSFLIMLIPGALSCGYCIILFGPIQDRLVAAGQRRSRAR
jgi:hypothetical protein